MRLGERCLRFDPDFYAVTQKPPRLLSHVSITAPGHNRSTANFEIYSMLCMFQLLKVFDAIKSLEIKKIATPETEYHYQGETFFSRWAHGAPVVFSNITDLSLECGEDNVEDLNQSLVRLQIIIPQLKRLSLTRVGLFVQKELEFLRKQRHLQYLSITELSSPTLDAEEGPDSIYATNLLVESMQCLLIPAALQRLKWIRARHQDFYAEVNWASRQKIEDIDVWFKYDSEWVMQGERYYAWDFHQELYHGTGTEDGWGPLWVERFMCES
ncbi:hypothetical protein AA313_de0201039 [Arthrobotrys entomopaga]|nr:hypothetical protein AA313_de0201039 [Arthrobotrys entomopaga]